MKKPRKPTEKPRVVRIALDLVKVKKATPVLVTCHGGRKLHYGKANLRKLAGGEE